MISLILIALKVWQASGASPYYRHADWLGSSRFASTASTRTMYNDLAYAPFGETYAATGSTGVTDISFAGNNEDTVANLYDAQFREYGIQGRWPSPDPAGIAAANPANPQSWNRYAYVLNNPLSLVDPLGFDCIYDDGVDDSGDTVITIVQGDCLSDTDGGYYVDGTVDPNSINLDSNGNLGFSFINNDEGTGGGGLISGFASGGTNNPFANNDQFNFNPSGPFLATGPTGPTPSEIAARAAARGRPNVSGPPDLTPEQGPTSQELMQKVLDETADTPEARALKALTGFITTFGNTLSDFMIAVSPCATPQLRAQFPGLCGGPMD